MKKVHTNKGFTLAELLIVVAIIAILVAVAIPTFGTQLERAREGVDLSESRNVYADAMTYFLTDQANEKTATYVKTIEFKQFVSGWTINPDFPCTGIDDVFGDSPTLPGNIKLKFSKATGDDGTVTVTVTAGAESDAETVVGSSSTDIIGYVLADADGKFDDESAFNTAKASAPGEKLYTSAGAEASWVDNDTAYYIKKTFVVAGESDTTGLYTKSGNIFTSFSGSKEENTTYYKEKA